MTIAWTKSWSSSDDGTIVSGTDLGNIQDDIDAGFGGNAASIQNASIAAPTVTEDGMGIYFDYATNSFKYKTFVDLTSDQTIGGTKTFSTPINLSSGGTGQALTDPGADRVLFWDESESKMAWLIPDTTLTITATSVGVSTTALGAWEYIEGAAFDATSASPLVITETLATGYVYKVIVAGAVYGTGGAVVINFKLNTTAVALVTDVIADASLYPFVAEGTVFYQADANITVAGFSNGIYKDDSADAYQSFTCVHSLASQTTSMSFYPVDAGPHLVGRYFLYRTKQ